MTLMPLVSTATRGVAASGTRSRVGCCVMTRNLNDALHRDKAPGRRRPLASTSQLPTAVSSRSTSAASSDFPSSAEAPAGSPRTPVGLTGRTPSRRSRGISSPMGRVSPATARCPRTHSGSTCNISDVSVRPACASPPGTPHGNQATSRPSARSSGTADRRASRLPPWPLTISTRDAHRQADRPYSTSRPVSASVPIEIVPGKPSCSPLAPYASAGASRTPSIDATAASAAAQATDVSVPSGRWCPCCSTDPSGTTSTGAPETSGQTDRSSQVTAAVWLPCRPPPRACPWRGARGSLLRGLEDPGGQRDQPEGDGEDGEQLDAERHLPPEPGDHRQQPLLLGRGEREGVEGEVPHRLDDVRQRVQPGEHGQPDGQPGDREQRPRQEHHRHDQQLADRHGRLDGLDPGGEQD